MKLLSQFFVKYPVIGLMLFYCILTLPHLDKGLADMDGHGTVASINRTLEGGGYLPSRAPGHPATEVILYLPVAYCVTDFFQIPFDWKIYNYLQWFGGLASTIAFYSLLRSVSSSKTMVVVGVLGLVTSHLFLGNAMDGSEFNWGLACVIIALRFLLGGFRKPEEAPWRAIIISTIFGAVATGFRQEFIFVFVIYPLFFYMHPCLSLRNLLQWLPAAILAGIAVWLPVLIQNSHSVPMPMPMPASDGLSEIRNRILGGGYKLLFLGLTLPVGIVLTGWVFRLAESHMKLMRSDREICFVYLSAVLVTIIYVGLYFFYPYKPDFILVIIPLLILMGVAVQWKNELYCLSVATFLSLVVQIDIFEERILVLPHVQNSLYWQKVKEKPHHKIEGLQTNIGFLAGKGKALLISSLWKSDFNYLINEGMIELNKLEEKNAKDRNFELFQSSKTKEPLIIASRRAIENVSYLIELQAEGYEVCIDEKLLRSFYFKYDVRFPIGNQIRVGNVEFTVI